MISLVADTDWNMVPDSAVGIDATQARTGVLTSKVGTGQFLGAVRVDHTLMSAVWWRSNHISQAGALAPVTNLSWQVAVGTTWVRITRVLCYYWLNNQGFLPACSEGISNVSSLTSAGGDVVDNSTLGIGPTQSRTGIHTVQVLTCLVRRTVSVDCTLRTAGNVGISKVVRNTST